MRVIFAVLLWCLTDAFCVNAQDAINIHLADDKAAYTPINFHVTDVVDKRTFTGSIGKVSEGNVTVPGGLPESIRAYAGLKPAQNSLPVSMHITRFEVKEKAVGSKRQFELSLGIAYYAGKAKLVEYNGNAFAQSATTAAPYIEKLIKDNISGNLEDFDKWVAKNRNTISVEPTVTVNVSLSRVTDNKNHIAYTKSRKLLITDFEGEPDEASIGAAATLSGIGMKMQASTLRNNTKVDVMLTVYFDRSRSWMKGHGKNVTTLQHEQLHFDITAIKACMLKQQIEQATFSPDNYKQELKEMLDKVQAETGDMQNEYDRETEHGTIIDEQEKWSKRIGELLQKQACY